MHVPPVLFGVLLYPECNGLNGVALFALLGTAAVSTGILLLTPPAPNAVFRLVIDYMQLASLIMTPVAGVHRC